MAFVAAGWGGVDWHMENICGLWGIYICFYLEPCFVVKSFDTMEPIKVYEAKWWAGMYGAPTWKRHIAWSSSPTVALLDLGRLCKKFKQRIAKFGVKSTKQYKSKSGKKKFCGSKTLRSTGPLGSSLVISNHLSIGTTPSYSNLFLESEGALMNFPFENHLYHILSSHIIPMLLLVDGHPQV